MQTALRNYHTRTASITTEQVDLASPRRSEVEIFIRDVFAAHYGADVRSFAPNLMLLEQGDLKVAATGWRVAASGPLFLECYLDNPIEQTLTQLAERPVLRSRIVEVGNLAAVKAGGSLQVILALAAHLDRLGHEWVVFTATQELIGIFTRLGLPLLALAKADPSRLGDEAKTWGDYYATEPIVVAGRIRTAIERLGRAA